MLLSLTRLKMAGDVESFGSTSAIALTAVVGAVVLLLILLCNFVKKGFEKSKTDRNGTPPRFGHVLLTKNISILMLFLRRRRPFICPYSVSQKFV